MAFGDRYQSRGRERNPAAWDAAFGEAARKGDTAALYWLLNVPPSADSGSRDPGRPLRRDPDLEFPVHRQALVRQLRAARGVEPREGLAGWAARVERLDIAQPQAGLDELRAIAGEYAQASSRYESSFSQLNRPLWLNDEAAGIGGELCELAELLSEALRRRERLRGKSG